MAWCEGRLYSHLAHLIQSPAQLVTQQKLHLCKILRAQFIINVVQQHPEQNKQKSGVKRRTKVSPVIQVYNQILCFHLYSDSRGIASVSSSCLLSAFRRRTRSSRRIVWSSWERKELFPMRHFSSNFENSSLALRICENKNKNNFEMNRNTMQQLILYIKRSTIVCCPI